MVPVSGKSTRPYYWEGCGELPELASMRTFPLGSQEPTLRETPANSPPTLID